MQLLSDAQVARFITDGYLILNADVSPHLHAAIYHKLDQRLHEEGNPGNNILPAVPELQEILDSPTVQGALTSILGRNYVLHPHRFVHNNEPGLHTAEGGKVGAGSKTFIGWHQDDHSPLARPRHHLPRYAMLLYYPQNTPIEMGPTQIIPATHLHRLLSEEDKARGFQAAGNAGTCVLVHFDLAHGGSLNIADSTRYMAKFVFVRAEEPEQPSWNCQRTAWETPEEHGAPYDSPVVWRHVWNWMAGQPQSVSQASPNAPDLHQALAQLETASAAERKIEAIQAIAAQGEGASAAVPALIAAFEASEFVCQNAIYALAAIGQSVVAPLCAELQQHTESGWNEGAVVMETSAYALAAIGKPAVSALTALLAHPSEWVQINAVFALGEMGHAAHEALPAVCLLLKSPSQSVVRTALDALGQIGAESEIALPALHYLLHSTHSEWQTPLYRKWTAQDQIRTNAAMALLRLNWRTEDATQLLADALHDPCGYVTGFGVEALIRQNTPRSLSAALQSLQAHRWDDSLRQGVRTF